MLKHEQALQEIADRNDGTRVSGTPGYDESVAYVAETMRAAGYQVRVQDFQFRLFRTLGPSELEQTAPGQVTYTEGVDFAVTPQSDPGNVEAAVTAVDLSLGLGNASTSGCEATDFAGFPAGNTALLQRGTCTFELKAENAAAAGAVGVIFFNQGNTTAPDRNGIPAVTLGNTYEGGIPAVSTTYALGVQLSQIQGLEMHLFANVDRRIATTHNDMVASPNYGLFVYDGDGSAFGLVGPDGSDEIEAVFERYYAERGIPSRPTAFSGRSDYQAFIRNGVPSGGLFTGAEGVKTAQEAVLWGGTAGIAYDPCYHQACDDIGNLSHTALGINADAVAYAMFNYAIGHDVLND